jgi:Mu transposase, C-terminal
LGRDIGPNDSSLSGNRSLDRNPKQARSRHPRNRIHSFGLVAPEPQRIYRLKLSHWIQTVYHLRARSSTGISPQFRFAHAASTLRHLDTGLELEPLFFTRIERTVRKNGIVRIEDTLYEVDLSLRALDVELRFDPYRMNRIEVYYRGKACGLARLVNSQLEGSQHYLLATLRLRSHRALYSRIAAHARIESLSRSEVEPYLEHQLRRVGIERPALNQLQSSF